MQSPSLAAEADALPPYDSPSSCGALWQRPAMCTQVVKEEGIDCGFKRVDGYLFPKADSDQQTLEKELAAAVRSGLTDVKMVCIVLLCHLALTPDILLHGICFIHVALCKAIGCRQCCHAPMHLLHGCLMAVQQRHPSVPASACCCPALTICPVRTTTNPRDLQPVLEEGVKAACKR